MTTPQDFPLPEEPWFPIRTERLLLRPFRADDYEDIQAYASDPETTRYMDWGPNTPEITRHFLGLKLQEQEVWPRADVSFAVEVVTEGRLIGATRLGLDGKGGADFGYSYGSIDWRKGYGYEAAHAIVTAAFETLGLHRVWATCDVRNTGSFKIMEKLGMRREGTLLKNQLVRDGWRDTHIYALLREEWVSRRPKSS